MNNQYIAPQTERRSKTRDTSPMMTNIHSYTDTCHTGSGEYNIGTGQQVEIESKYVIGEEESKKLLSSMASLFSIKEK